MFTNPHLKKKKMNKCNTTSIKSHEVSSKKQDNQSLESVEFPGFGGFQAWICDAQDTAAIRGAAQSRRGCQGLFSR